MSITRRNLLAGAASAACLFHSPARAGMTITAFPATDLENGRFDLAANLSFAAPEPRPALPGEGLPPSAIRLSDDSVLDGNQYRILCSSGSAGLSSAVTLYCTSAGMLSDGAIVENLRFEAVRYGIVTPFEADRPEPPAPSVDEWYTRGQYIIRNITGTAYERGIRIAGRNSLIEDCVLYNIGGTTAEPKRIKRSAGITVKGPAPIVRRCVVRDLIPVPSSALPRGMESESLGVYIEADSPSALIEYVEISNQSIVSGSYGIWVGHSHGVTVRHARVSNMVHALHATAGETSSGLIEDSHSFNCHHGFEYVASNPAWKLRNVWDHQFVDGVWKSTDVSNL